MPLATKSQEVTNRLVRCLFASVFVHALVFGGYKIAKEQGWTLSPQIALFENWALPKDQKELEKLLVPPTVEPPKLNTLNPVELVFLDVDPNQELVEPPKETKFYGAVSTRAENREQQKPSTTPKIEGNQTKVARITEPSRPAPRPLQPTPAPAEKQLKPEPEKIAPTPAPVKPPEKKPEVVAKPVPVQEPPKTTPPEEKLPSLEVIKPVPKKEEVKVALNRATPSAAQPKAQQPNVKETPARTRPRRLADVAAPNTGESMKQEGGVGRLAMRSNMDVRGTIVGDYDARFIRAVEHRWRSLLEGRGATKAGEVVVSFRLTHDGRIQNLKVSSNSAGEILGIICEKAILDPAPFDRWPVQMRNELRQDYRDVKFTFHYLDR